MKDIEIRAHTRQSLSQKQYNTVAFGHFITGVDMEKNKLTNKNEAVNNQIKVLFSFSPTGMGNNKCVNA